MNPRNTKKILIGKIGLDGHDRGVKIIINFLKQEGYQVVYSGLHRTPRQLIDIAIQESADAIGISILSGSHVELLNELNGLKNQLGLSQIPIFAGGVISKNDEATLLRNGLAAVFGSGVSISEIINWVDSKLI
jgi:methylmalonyl-CoA mutase C-terminal domain/subunit